MKELEYEEWKKKAREWAILVPDRKKLFKLLSAEVEQGIPVPQEKEGASPTGTESSDASQEGEEESEEMADQESKALDPAPMEQEILTEAVRDRILYDPEEALAEEEKEKASYPAQETNPPSKEGSQESRRTKSGKGGKKRFTDWLDPSSKGEEGIQDREERSEKGLIEAFIEKGEERPRPVQEKREFFSSERMAQKSSDETELPVSETLAEIYVKQGDLKRAKEAFEKLRLKFPEKNDYFVRRIEELKDRSKH